MIFAKYSFPVLVFLLSFGATASAKSYTAKNCLDQDFEAKTQGNGSLFGLLKHDLTITKSDCVIEAHETKYFYLKTNWKIDICREPIHLKKEQFKSTSVFKKTRKCNNGTGSEFCTKTKELLNLFKDVGLIFAEGNRQSLDSDHGKTYCAYLLLKEYLESDSVFVSGQESVFIDGLQSSFAPPKKIEDIKPMVKNVINNIKDNIDNAAKVMEEAGEEVFEAVEASGSF